MLIPTGFEKHPDLHIWGSHDGTCGELWKGSWRLCRESNKNPDGHKQIAYTKPDGTRGQCVKAVAMHEIFLGPVPDGYEVDHLNDIPWDDRPLNLKAKPQSAHTSERKHRGGNKNKGRAVVAKHRDGPVLHFVNRNQCAGYFHVNSKRVEDAMLRGTYAKRKHSPFKDWLVDWA